MCPDWRFEWGLNTEHRSRKCRTFIASPALIHRHFSSPLEFFWTNQSWKAGREVTQRWCHGGRQQTPSSPSPSTNTFTRILVNAPHSPGPWGVTEWNTRYDQQRARTSPKALQFLQTVKFFLHVDSGPLPCWTWGSWRLKSGWYGLSGNSFL